MPPEKAPQSGPETKPAQPVAAPEAAPAPAEKPADAIKSLGKKITDTFNTKDGLKGFVDEFKKIIDSTFDQFTKDFQSNFSKSDGKADMSEILSLFGLDKLLAPFLTPDKATPDKSATTGTTASSSPSTQPQAHRNTAAAGAAAGAPSSAIQATTSAAPSTTPGFTLSAPTDISEIPPGNGIIPENPGTMTGTQFMAEVRKLGNTTSPENQRKIEAMVIQCVDKGFVPSYSRLKTPVSMRGPDGTIITFLTSANYFAIGNDEDSIPPPISPKFAQTVLGRRYHMALPTGPMTDTIYAKANIKLRGIGLVNNSVDEKQMRGSDFFERHNSLINHQLNLALDPKHTKAEPKPNEKLSPATIAKLKSGQYTIGGHKKDNIIAAEVAGNPQGPMAFRGLYIDGINPIQTNSAHGWNYFDYASGDRFIGADNVQIRYPKGHPLHPNGYTETTTYFAALANPHLGNILNRGTGKGNGEGTGSFNARLAYVDPRNQAVA